MFGRIVSSIMQCILFCMVQLLVLIITVEGLSKELHMPSIYSRLKKKQYLFFIILKWNLVCLFMLMNPNGSFTLNKICKLWNSDCLSELLQVFCIMQIALLLTMVRSHRLLFSLRSQPHCQV